LKNQKSLKTVAAVLGAMVTAGALMFGPGLLAAGDENKTEIENSETTLFSVKTENAEKRTLRAFLEANSDMVSGQEAAAFPDVSGKLIRVNAALGSPVRQGDVIAEVDPSKPGQAT
jgi:multidrug efflux pump subunit AcrA (membrane-fusion protein)